MLTWLAKLRRSSSKDSTVDAALTSKTLFVANSHFLDTNVNSGNNGCLHGITTENITSYFLISVALSSSVASGGSRFGGGGWAMLVLYMSHVLLEDYDRLTAGARGKVNGGRTLVERPGHIRDGSCVQF